MVSVCRICALLFILFSVLPGCGPTSDAQHEPAPRPVSVFELEITEPAIHDQVTGVVASWKTEEIGFEVAGRVEYVIEPETNFTGEVRDKDNNLLGNVKVLARLDKTRYVNKLNAIKAQISSVEKQQDALRIEIDEVLKAEGDAAVAQRDLSRIEVERNTRLVKQNAAPIRALDQAKASLKVSEAAIAQTEASKKAKEAEMQSLEAKKQELNETLKDAQRDLDDCQLTVPFTGQVAEVHVIPGSYVERGESVVTAQMMDPIKIEFEVSPARSRTLKYKDFLDVTIPQANATPLHQRATVYMIDPVADPNTRTFTVTLLLENEEVKAPLPADLEGKPIATTQDFWRFHSSDLVPEGTYLLDVNSIHEDGDEQYVWKVTNWDAVSAGETNVLEVTKIRITRGDLQIPFLGLWTFAQVSVNEGEDFDPKKDIVAAKLILPEDASSWDEKKILFQRKRWRLRPGDLVGVDLSGGESLPGFYVSLSAIVDKSGEFFVFVAEPSEGGGSQAKRIEVALRETIGTRQRIESAGEVTLKEKMRVILDGVHFLVDGEKINVAEVIK